MKYIVLRSGFDDGLFQAWRKDFSSRLKQHALLFDQIGILRLSQLRDMIYSYMEGNSHPPDLAQTRFEPLLLDLEWLEENSILFDATIENEFTERDFDSILETNPIKANELRKLAKSFDKLRKKNISFKTAESTLDSLDLIKKQDGALLRFMSIVMETTKNTSAITTLPYKEYTVSLPTTNKSSVAQITVNKLPLPDNETPWEKIIDYRTDSESKNDLLALRKWIGNIATQNRTPLEIEQEIEWLISEFQRHMKFHKIKANHETLEVLVKSPLALVENLAKFQFSKIPDPLFALKRRQIMLMEAELNAPGREMSYIIKSNSAFQG